MRIVFVISDTFLSGVSSVADLASLVKALIGTKCGYSVARRPLRHNARSIIVFPVTI